MLRKLESTSMILKFGTYSISLDCHQLYIHSEHLFAIGLPPQCCDLCQISSISVETTLYSRFGGGVGIKGEKAEAYVGQILNCFNSILLANQDNSPGQPRQFLRAATAVRYNYYVQLVAVE